MSLLLVLLHLKKARVIYEVFHCITCFFLTYGIINVFNVKYGTWKRMVLTETYVYALFIFTVPLH